MFRRFCGLLNHPEWGTEAEFADTTTRVRNHAALAARIEAVTGQQPRAHWLALFEANEIPCGPINNYEQVFAGPHITAREMAVDVEHPTLGRIRSLGSPLEAQRDPTDPRRRAPMLGEHTDAVLNEYGFSAGEIASLRAGGAVA